MLALRGARKRREAERDNHILTAWLSGLLSRLPPKDYPKLDTLLGRPRSAKRRNAIDPAEASANARAWGAWLRAVNRQATRRRR